MRQLGETDENGALKDETDAAEQESLENLLEDADSLFSGQNGEGAEPRVLQAGTLRTYRVPSLIHSVVVFVLWNIGAIWVPFYPTWVGFKGRLS